MSISDPKGLEERLDARDTARTIFDSTKFDKKHLESLGQDVLQEFLYVCDQKAIVNQQLSTRQDELYAHAANITEESRPTPKYLLK